MARENQEKSNINTLIARLDALIENQEEMYEELCEIRTTLGLLQGAEPRGATASMTLLSETSDALTDDSFKALYLLAKSYVAHDRCAGASYLQRELEIPYTQARALMTQLEADGHIGPDRGAQPREIFIERFSVPMPSLS